MRQRARKIKETDFASVCRAFQASPLWAGYSWNTRDQWGRELRLIERADTLGGLSVHVIRPALVQAFLDGLSDRPGKQAASLSVLRRVESWAIPRDLLPYPITTGVEFERSKNGHKPWTDEQVALAEARARPDLARVVTLAVNTGQRGSDLVRLCWTDLEVYNGLEGFHFVQQKTGKEMWVPVTRELAQAMATWERAPGPILRNAQGGAWIRHTLSTTWDRHRDTNPALASLSGCVLHGLRATACQRLARAGATSRQVADMVGMSEQMVSRYLRFSVQRENASAAVHYLDRARGGTGGERTDGVARKTHT